MIFYGGHFDLDKEKSLYQELNNQMNDPLFWNKTKEEQDLVINQISILKKHLLPLEEIIDNINNNLDLINELENNYDQELLNIIENDYHSILKKYQEIEILLLLNGEYDGCNCIMEIHSGAGGTEACDWVAMLYRMYTRYFNKKGYKYEEISHEDGDVVGYKSVSIYIKGENAYGYLKQEKGIHRLVRISPFDSGNRRHTSFASVDIIPDYDKNININILESDLKIDVYRSTGAGGQGVNTTDSAVRITHIPTSIVITCQNERSQIQNKEKALELLKNKLYDLEMQKQQEKLSDMKKDNLSINFGSGKRSYVMCPYTLVKDNDSAYETPDVMGILDGELDDMINQGLKGVKND